MTLAALAITALFALTHIFIGRLTFLSGVPRSRWLSLAGGIAVAYVFLHLLPELAIHHETLGGERRIYLMALAGLLTFYGLERAIKRRDRHTSDKAGLYHLHLGAYAVYNLLIGYLLLHREDTGALSLALYAMAMALHFVTTDFGLYTDHGARYDRHGRWLLTLGAFGGWLLGATLALPEPVIALLFGFLAGGVVLNVLKEELPEERDSHFGAFLAGAAAYAGLLLVI